MNTTVDLASTRRPARADAPCADPASDLSGRTGTGAGSDLGGRTARALRTPLTSPTGALQDAQPLHARLIHSPVGPLRLVAGERGLRAILWERDGLDAAARDAHELDGDAPTLDLAERQLGEYFAGTRRTFDLPLDPVGSPFQQQVWQVLRTIPYGRTMSYGEQARALGDVNKARAVGAANGRNPLSIVVPCHRVVGATGKLTGFAGGLDVKAWLLDHERGVERLPA